MKLTTAQLAALGLDRGPPASNDDQLALVRADNVARGLDVPPETPVVPRHDMANRGLGLEAGLSQMHAQYEREGRAWVYKQHVPRSARGDIIGSPAPTDYLGALRDGTAIAVEAKERTEERFKFSALSRRQQAFLESWPGLSLVVSMFACSAGTKIRRSPKC